MASRIAALPSSFRKIICSKISTSFSEATEIVSVPIRKPKETEVLIRTRYLGINASDINFTAARYFAEPSVKLPFDVGFEAIGEVIDKGDSVVNVEVGQAVGCINFGAFSEYLYIPGNDVCHLPSVKPEFVGLLISGRTAAISLDKVGHIKKNNTVLITAAAGGTGSIAVQYAKYKGCHVIGTCSSDDKVGVLKKLGCDRPINYKNENLLDVLKAEYPKGVDVVWESIGGDMFLNTFKSLAIKGRLIIIGYISSYETKSGYNPLSLGHLPQKLLLTSSSVGGFFLGHYEDEYMYYHVNLLSLLDRKKMKVLLDQGKETEEGVFHGLESVERAVKHLYSGKSIGKVVVEIPW